LQRTEGGRGTMLFFSRANQLCGLRWKRTLHSPYRPECAGECYSVQRPL